MRGGFGEKYSLRAVAPEKRGGGGGGGDLVHPVCYLSLFSKLYVILACLQTHTTT